MMPSQLNTSMTGLPHIQHESYSADSMLDELSIQLAAVNSRRLSRGSSGQRTAVNAMRITKPGSANNSPRSAMLQSRRRTLICDGLQGRLPPAQPMETLYLPTPAPEQFGEPIYDVDRKAARPVSWHPSSHLSHQQPFYPQLNTRPYHFPSYNDADMFAMHQLPPTPSVYSNYTSPSSTFSPLSLPYSSVRSQQQSQPQYHSPTNRSLPAQQSQAPVFQPAQTTYQPMAGTVSEIPYQQGPRVTSAALDWEAFARGGFDRCTAPPTPEYFEQPQKQQPKVVAAEDPIPYQPLEDHESEGEILYGMGLYDAPDKGEDPLFGLHRSTVFSLLGSGGTYPVPTGKGLKLEDAWEPPASDDEDEEGSEDAEGEDQE